MKRLTYRQAPAHIRGAIQEAAARWETIDGTPLTELLDAVEAAYPTSRECSACDKPANVYAGGPYAGDWANYYCQDHIPTGFTVWDRLGGKP